MDLAVKEKGEYIAVREMRKHICWYLKNLKDSSKVREEINRLETRQEVEERLKEYFNSLQNKNKNRNRNSKTLFLFLYISIFLIINYKNIKIGNNKCKSSDNILNIESQTEINDVSDNTLFYILYNEIELK